MQNENDIRDAGIEAAQKYLRQKDWERMNYQRDFKRSIFEGLTMLAVLAFGFIGTYAVLFGNL